MRAVRSSRTRPGWRARYGWGRWTLLRCVCRGEDRIGRLGRNVPSLTSLSKPEPMKRTIPLFLLGTLGLVTHAQVIFSENFEAYAAGSPLASVAPLHWDTWSGAPGGPEDGVVDDSLAHTGSNSLKILQTVVGGGPDDLLLLLGDS